MRFGPSNASSVDLCVRDLIAASRFRATTTIVCCENETLFPDLNITTYSAKIDASKRRKVAFALKLASKVSADLVVVQQHLPTAAVLARRIAAPVIFHKHNMTKPIPEVSLINKIRRKWRLRQYKSLAGLIFVSDACRDNFRKDWPEVTTPLTVVYNGLDFSEWRPSTERANEIICVGRASPDKGIREAADAIAMVLASQQDWHARLILSEPKRFPEYLNEVLDSLRSVASRVTVEFSQPLSVVRQRLQDAAIAIIPSRWEEPFGRTALEAHAAGCAVVSSISGGLPEVNRDNALLLPKDFKSADIADKLKILIADSDLRRSLALKGRAYCERQFSLAKVSSSADDFYDEVVRFASL
jgi:glycosyltransferase involved in cell wall biosynthesis